MSTAAWDACVAGGARSFDEGPVVGTAFGQVFFVCQLHSGKRRIPLLATSDLSGGTLGNELAQKGGKVVILEAGGRNEIQDFVNDEWNSFTQLAWKDMRTTSGSWRVAISESDIGRCRPSKRSRRWSGWSSAILDQRRGQAGSLDA